MKKITKILTAVLTAGVTALTAVPFQVSAVEKNSNIVLLGDGVFSGAGLSQNDRSCVEILDSMTDAEIHNFSSDTATTADVLALLDDADVQSSLASADVIIVSVGMQDVFVPYIAEVDTIIQEYRDNGYELEHLTDLFDKYMYDYGIGSLDELDVVASQISGRIATAARSKRNDASANLESIGEKLSAYPNAKVMYVNCFNIMDTLSNVADLTSRRQDAYNVIKRPVGSVLNSDKINLNSAIRNNASNYGSTIIDTFNGFAGMAYEYGYLPVLTPNPSRIGHEWIGLEILSGIAEDENSGVMGTLKMGDVNCDGNIDAADAAKVLVHSANKGGGSVGYFGTYAEKIANVSTAGKTLSEGETDEIDAIDAAFILQYAALQGSGEAPDFAEIVKQSN